VTVACSGRGWLYTWTRAPTRNTCWPRRKIRRARVRRVAGRFCVVLFRSPRGQGVLDHRGREDGMGGQCSTAQQGEVLGILLARSGKKGKETSPSCFPLRPTAVVPPRRQPQQNVAPQHLTLL